GVQVRSLNGRIDFAVRAPSLDNGQVPDPITVRAEHPIAGRCAGTARITFTGPGSTLHTAIDFTATEGNDPEVTNALWDTALGRVDPFPSDFGAGEDGDITIDGSYNINRDAQPGRLFPDAVNFIVEAIGEASVTVEGGVGGVEIGDEVLLINLQGDNENHGNVGNYEIKEIARINYGQNTIFFTTNLTKIYGATDSNENLAGQKLMLQRVPRYRSLRVNGNLTADEWDGTKGGIFFVKVLGSADIRGTLEMNHAGYRIIGSQRGESIGGDHGEGVTTPIGGGGTGVSGHPSPNQHGWHSGWTSYCGSGGSYGSQGERDCYQNGRIVFEGQQSSAYGTPQLDQWHLGSGGGRSASVEMYCCWGQRHHRERSGADGGGAIVLWASGISVRGEIRSRSSGSLSGSGGMIFLRARSMNVGNNRVDATGGDRGGDGRIRLDFFGLSGTTDPEYHPGFAGDTVMQTDDLSGVGNPIQSVTLSRVLADLRGGSINYQVTNGATDNEQNLIWNDIAAGETFTFPENQPGTALRMRATFRNDNLQPLALIGLSLEWTRGE
ncbi:MAG: hypothetical protein CMH55_03025, partial [Myxococcales bacterium]|nr:hypothetical protein [Myxococcales bacterium]